MKIQLLTQCDLLQQNMTDNKNNPILENYLIEESCDPDVYGDNGSDCDPDYWDPCGPNE